MSQSTNDRGGLDEREKEEAERLAERLQELLDEERLERLRQMRVKYILETVANRDDDCQEAYMRRSAKWQRRRQQEPNCLVCYLRRRRDF